MGSRTRVKVVKNKVAPPFKQCEFDIMYGEGISKVGDLLDIAADVDIIKKSGAWYSYNDMKLGQGRENVKKFLMDNPDLAEEVEDLVRKHYKLDQNRENAQENEDSLETFYRFWKEKNNEKLIIQKYDWFAGYLEDKKTADLTPITRNPCWHLRRDFVILLNGDVSICREELLSGSQGNVFSESLESIWTKRKSFLENYVKGNLTSLCEKCDEYYTFNF